MIHRARLPSATAKCLLEVVGIQFALLGYAATRGHIGRDDCAAYLASSDTCVPSAEAIASWTWAAPSRRDSLSRFAAGPLGTKASWVELRRDEVRRLAEDPTGQVTP